MTFRYEVGENARADIFDILVRSHAEFGGAVRDGYEELLLAAFSDVSRDPTRPGVRDRSELGDGVRAWHLALSRDHVRAGARRIVRPRHVVLFRIVGDVVQILRVLHEAMDPGLHRFD